MQERDRRWLRRHLVAVLAVKFVLLALLWLFFRHGASPVESAQVGDAVLRAPAAAFRTAKE